MDSIKHPSANIGAYGWDRTTIRPGMNRELHQLSYVGIRLTSLSFYESWLKFASSTTKWLKHIRDASTANWNFSTIKFYW